ncbi:MAG: hypothetical protein GY953_43220, partial [bacterium]|nr:hypothetical protein [bacterium]
AVRAGVENVARWIKDAGYANVLLEIANEFGHRGFDHPILRTAEGQAELIKLAKKSAPELPVSTSGLGGGTLPDVVARVSDFLLIHYNNTELADIPRRIRSLMAYGKPVVCNEDAKVGVDGASAAALSVANGASWGYMNVEVNQHYPFRFNGADDDPEVYSMLRRLTTTRPAAGAMVDHEDGHSYFPPPESEGGWRKLETPDDIRRLAGVDPVKLAELEQWLLRSDKRGRDFSAVVIRRGHIVLEVEKGINAKTGLGRGGIASCAKAILATSLAIASQQS